MNARSKPAPGEMAAFYERYIAACGDDDLIAALQSSLTTFAGVVTRIPDELGDHRYAPGKWTVKDVLQHVIDTERVMAYRALRFARNDATELPGFEEDDWARAAQTEHRRLDLMLAEAHALRQSTLFLFESMTPEELMRKGVANGQPCSARATGWIIAGHMLHHTRIITERYLSHAEA